MAFDGYQSTVWYSDPITQLGLDYTVLQYQLPVSAIVTSYQIEVVPIVCESAYADTRALLRNRYSIRPLAQLHGRCKDQAMAESAGPILIASRTSYGVHLHCSTCTLSIMFSRFRSIRSIFPPLHPSHSTKYIFSSRVSVRFNFILY